MRAKLTALFRVLTVAVLVRITLADPPGTHLPYLHRIAEASAQLLLGNTSYLPLGHFAPARALRNSSGQSVGVDFSGPLGSLNRTVLVSYRYPSPTITFASEDAEQGDFIHSTDAQSPYRLLSQIEDDFNDKLFDSDFNIYNAPARAELAANIIARNMVLARLYFSLTGPKPGQLGGLQSIQLPLTCAYLTGLHMEVLTIPLDTSVESVRALLAKDPFVEQVWADAIMDGKQILGDESNLYDDPALESEPPFLLTNNELQKSLLEALPNVGVHNQEETFGPVVRGESASPNDPRFHEQWPHHNPITGVNTPEAWKSWTGEKSNFVIALVDSGVDLNHPDLLSQYWRNTRETDCFNGIDDDGNGYVDDCIGWDWIENDNVPQDENGHGTASAGIMAAVTNNQMGIAGVCWGCKIMVLRTLDRDIRGTISGFIKAIDYAVVQGVKVSNNSYGGRGSSFASLRTAVKRAKNHGMVFVAAAGNYGSNNDYAGLQPTYPASYNDSNILSVGAIDSDGQLASFSCYGKKSVDLAAPGVKILSTALANRYTTMDGTSFSTPFVTGAVSLIWSKEPELSADEVISRLLGNVRQLPSLRNKVSTGGTLDIFAALADSSKPPLSSPSDETNASTAARRSAASQASLGDANIQICSEDNTCPPFSTCIDTKNGPKCRCLDGYQHNGGQCFALEGCLPNSPQSGCQRNEICEVGSGGSGMMGRCACKPGFQKQVNTGSCIDTDECKIDPYICPRSATCVNTEGAFDCVCPIGTRWNGLALIQKGAKCEPERSTIFYSDPCKENNGGCGSNAACTVERLYTSSRSLLGPVHCTCHSGYVWSSGIGRCIKRKEESSQAVRISMSDEISRIRSLPYQAWMQKYEQGHAASTQPRVKLSASAGPPRYFTASNYPSSKSSVVKSKKRKELAA